MSSHWYVLAELQLIHQEKIQTLAACYLFNLLSAQC